MLVIFLCVNNKYLVRNHLLVYLTLCSQSRNCFGVYRQVVSYRLNLCFFFLYSIIGKFVQMKL